MTLFNTKEAAETAAIAAGVNWVHLVQTRTGQHYIASRGPGQMITSLIAAGKLDGVRSVRESYSLSTVQAVSQLHCNRCKQPAKSRYCRSCESLMMAMNDCSTGSIRSFS
jgi:hypothetical protein